MVSGGGVKHDYRLDFATEAEAEQAAAEDDWRYVDENQFEWRLEVEEDLTAVKQAVKNRNTEEVEAESISYAVCQYYGIRLPTTALAISPPGARTRRCRSCGPVWRPSTRRPGN